jgi:site-specific recombinase XerD
MHVLLWLNKSKINSRGLIPLMMRITINGNRINFTTPIAIEEKSWNKNKQSIKGEDKLIEKYNQYLFTLKTQAWDFYNESNKKGITITSNQVREYILGNDTSQYTLIEALDYQINHLKARIGNDIAPATIKSYEVVKRKVITFLQTERGLEDILLNEVTYQFISEFDQFIRVKQGLHNNGVVKNMQQLKRVITVALSNEWISKNPFAKYNCKIIEPKRVFLTWEELKCLEELALPNERLNKVRDVFVFSCYTGLAYSDVSKLNKVHITQMDGKDWIILDRTKTKNQSTIPIFPKAREILDKYSSLKQSKLLPVISSQNLNKYIKEIAKLANINKQLSFHAARHTFASSVTLNKGVDITTVSAMLGHKMLKTTQIYAKVNTVKIAKDVDQFFKE